MKKHGKEILINKKKSSESDEYKKLITLIIIITVSFLALYLITTIFTKKENDSIFKNDLDPSEIQYNEIIIGSMFDMDGENYVLLLDKDDTYKELYTSLVTSVRDNKNIIYTVDLSSAFNKKYISDENNYDEDDFKVSKTTLIKIENKKITSHYEEKEDIYNKLSDLSKKD